MLDCHRLPFTNPPDLQINYLCSYVSDSPDLSINHLCSYVLDEGSATVILSDDMCCFVSQHEKFPKEGSDTPISVSIETLETTHETGNEIEEEGEQMNMIGIEMNLNAIDCDIGPTPRSLDVNSTPFKINKMKQGKVNICPDEYRAQFDYGAFVSVTGNQEILHGYHKFNKKHNQTFTCYRRTRCNSGRIWIYAYTSRECTRIPASIDLLFTPIIDNSSGQARLHQSSWIQAG